MTKEIYANEKVKEFLTWLSNEPSFNIPPDEIDEILQDWNYSQSHNK